MREKFWSRVVPAALFAVAASALAAAEVSDGEWARIREAAKNRPRPAIYENDGDDCLVFPKTLEKSIANYLSVRTSYLNKCPGITTVFYTPTEAGFGHVSLRMKNCDPLLVKVPDTLSGSNLTPWLFEHGTDTLTEQIKYARANDLEIFVDVRTNDIHDVADRPGAPHLLFSPFKRKHPELLCGTWDKPSPYGAWSSLDYDQKGVQDYFLAHVGELIEKYDIDGVSFDFNRRQTLFKSVAWGGTATDAQREIVTNLMREVKRLAEKHGRRRNRPVLIAIRVPDSVEYCRAIGIDLEKWLAEGLVDMLIGAGDFRLNPWEYTVKLARKYGAKCYASIDMPQFSPSLGRLARTTESSYHARSAAAFAAGMDGNYYFNLFNPHAAKNLMLPREMLKTRNKRYHLTDRHLSSPEGYLRGGERYCNLPEIHANRPPLVLLTGERKSFTLEIGDDFESLKRDGINYEVTAIIAGVISDPAKLIVDSGTGPWKYCGSVEGYHSYAAPEGALKYGINRFEIEAGGIAAPKPSWQTIMKGNRLLLGDNQPPWRRLFDRSDSANAEKIVDGAYRMFDAGKGCNNLLYPLPRTKYPLHFGFDLRVEKTSDDRSVVFRFADGNFVEIISFAANNVKLLYSGKSAKFDTTKFHRYEGIVEDGKLRLLADGKELLVAPLVMKVGDPRGELHGFTWAIPNMHDRSLLYGSLSDRGTSVSYWKNLQLFRPAGSVMLMDCAVEVNFPKPLKISAPASWSYRASDSRTLAAGKHTYSRDELAAEVDLRPGSSTEIVFSNGGSMAKLRVVKGQIIAPDGRPVGMIPADKDLTLLVNLKHGEFLVKAGDAVAGAGTSIVTMELKTPTYAQLDPAVRTVIRNGGVAVVSGDAPAAMRANLTAPAVEMPEGVKWDISYDASAGAPGAEWQSTYPANCVAVSDGVLKLDNRSGGNQRWASFNLADAARLANPGKRIVIELEVANGGELAAATPEFFTFGAAVFSGGKQQEIIVRLAPNGVNTSFGRGEAEFPVGKFRKVTALLDTESGNGALWVDGKFILGGKSGSIAARKQPVLFWGDCSGSAGGLAEVRSFRIGTAGR